jgi:hypothetical protein
MACEDFPCCGHDQGFCEHLEDVPNFIGFGGGWRADNGDSDLEEYDNGDNFFDDWS